MLYVAAQQGMRSLSPTEMQHQRRESNGATSSASLLIKPSQLNRVVQNPISIHDIEKPGSAQLMSFYSAANSPMLGSRNYPLTPLRPPSPPFRNMKGFVLQAKPTNNVCERACMYVCMYVCMYAYFHSRRIQFYAQDLKFMYVYMYVCMHVCMFTYL